MRFSRNIIFLLLVVPGCLATSRIVGVGAGTGPSMYPTLDDRSVLIFERITPWLERYRVGDVIIAHGPRGELIAKRIRATAGQRIRMESGFFGRTIEIPDGHIWAEGDNRQFSTDSRVFGPIPMDKVVGRVFFKVYPFSQFGWVPPDPNGSSNNNNNTRTWSV